VIAEAGLGAGDTVVDLGCGTGILTRVFEAHARDGVVEYPYRTVALVFRVAANDA
jgi:ubiquinone/menaquinone biosynthesis C-methylase UbiE